MTNWSKKEWYAQLKDEFNISKKDVEMQGNADYNNSESNSNASVNATEDSTSVTNSMLVSS